MRARIHHGAHEIGGNCVEVEHDGAVLVLDVGRPLSAGRGAHVALPSVEGLGDGNGQVVGCVISHAHQDHWGLVDQVSPNVPVFIGERAASVLREAAFWGSGIDLAPAGFLEHRRPFGIGPFTITPFLNDHSAFDAYSVMVEAGGERLFYTGDIRGHGRKAAIFDSLLEQPPADIDVLLMEGTNVREAASIEAKLASEADVELAMAESMASADGLAVVVGSAQNVDRLVTAYRAAKRAGRTFVMDAYSAAIVEATNTPTIPRPGTDWTDVRTYLPRSQAIRIKKAEAFERASAIKPWRVFPEQLAADPSRYVLFGSVQSEVPRLLAEGALDNRGLVIWSLWDGYLAEPSGERFTAMLNAAEVPLNHHHTSGHASTADLRRLVTALSPRAVVPIHSSAPELFTHVAGRAPVVQHPDGHWWSVRDPITT